MSSLWTRVLARFIDGLIFAAIAGVGGFVLEIIIRGALFHWINFTYFLFLIYNLIMVSMSGQTIGKRCLKIKLADQNENKLGFGRVLFRESVVFIVLYNASIDNILREYIPSYEIHRNIAFILALALPLIDLSLVLINKKQLLHDVLFHTKVIDV